MQKTLNRLDITNSNIDFTNFNINDGRFYSIDIKAVNSIVNDCKFYGFINFILHDSIIINSEAEVEDNIESNFYHLSIIANNSVINNVKFETPRTNPASLTTIELHDMEITDSIFKIVSSVIKFRNYQLQINSFNGVLKTSYKKYIKNCIFKNLNQRDIYNFYLEDSTWDENITPIFEKYGIVILSQISHIEFNVFYDIHSGNGNSFEQMLRFNINNIDSYSLDALLDNLMCIEPDIYTTYNKTYIIFQLNSIIERIKIYSEKLLSLNLTSL